MAENVVDGWVDRGDDRRRIQVVGAAAAVTVGCLIVLGGYLVLRGDGGEGSGIASNGEAAASPATVLDGQGGQAGGGGNSSNGDTSNSGELSTAALSQGDDQSVDGDAADDESVNRGSGAASTGDAAELSENATTATSIETSTTDQSQPSTSRESATTQAERPTTVVTTTSASTARASTVPPSTSRPTTSRLTTSRPTTSRPTTSRPTTSRPTTTQRQSTGDRSIADLERRWAADRKKVVARLNEGDYGVGPDNVLRGPGGLRVDLNHCPSDWADSAGLEPGMISIDMILPTSGNLAAYGNYGWGMHSYFDYVNRTGGVDGRRIEFSLHDDGYISNRTVGQVERLLAGRQPFSISTLGTPPSIAVYDRLNDSCVPQPFVISGHPAWGDAANHPFTTGLQMSYRTEAALWGEWIRRNMADRLPVTVRSLVMDNDFGLAYDQGFLQWVRANPGVVSDYQAVRHDPAAPTVTNEMAIIESDNPDVFLSMTAGNPCLLAVQEAGMRGLTDTAVAFTPSVCRAAQSYMNPAGDAAEGFLTVASSLTDLESREYDGGAFVDFMNRTLKADGLDPTVRPYGAGFGLYAWTYVEALRIAAQLDGGLSRSNLLLAMWALDIEHPLSADRGRLRTNGPADPYPIEASNVERWDAKSQRWVWFTGTTDINGKTTPCRWTSGRGC